MNEHPRFTGDTPAVLQYLDGEFRVVQPGAYVICAVTGDRIALDQLRYWNVDLQEAYRDAAVALRRHRELAARQAG